MKPLRAGAVTSAVLLATLAAAPAAAQTMDYGGFEQLMGQPVTLSATGLPTTVSDVPAEMEIITADEIRRSGATDIPGILAHVVGVDVQNTGALAANVSIRGYNQLQTPRLLVLLDGRQVYMDIYGAAIWGVIPVTLDDIRQIEIVKGPNSALFGFNAVGGVINIVTWNPLHDTVHVATLSDGNGDHRTGSGTATVRLGDNTALKLAAQITRDDDYAGDRTSDASYNNPHTIYQSFIAASLHQILFGGEFELEATHANLEETEFPLFAVPQYMRYVVDSLKAEFTGDTPAGMVTLRAYRNMSAVDTTIVNALELDYYNKLTVLQAQDVVKLGASHSIRIAAEYRNSIVDTTPIGGAHVLYNIGSLSGAWNWHALPWLTLTSAARVDRLWLQRTGLLPITLPGGNDLWNRVLTVATMNFGAVARLGPNDTLRLTAARGAQLPNLVEFGALQLFYPPFAFSGQPFIKPSRVDNIEFDWDHTFAALGTTMRFAAFGQETHDLPVEVGPPTTIVGPIHLGFSENIGNSREIGIELAFKGNLPGGFTWSLGGSERAVHDRLDPGDSTLTSGVDYQQGTPCQTANADLGWAHGKWEIDAFARYQASSYGVTGLVPGAYVLAPIPAYVAIDGRIAYKVARGITVSLTGQNLGTRETVQSAFARVDRRVQANIAVRF